jgi:hypothetical protein
MKKSYTTPILIFSIIITILAIGIFIFFYKVIENKNQHASAVITTLQEKMKEKDDSITFAEKVAEIKTLQTSVNNHFVDPNTIDTFVNYLEEMGSNLGSQTSVKDIQIPDKIKNTIVINLLITGTFNNVMRTITYLENIPYRINITDMYLNKNIEQQSGDLLATGAKNKTPTISTWQADITFSILSL